MDQEEKTKDKILEPKPEKPIYRRTTFGEIIYDSPPRIIEPKKTSFIDIKLSSPPNKIPEKLPKLSEESKEGIKTAELKTELNLKSSSSIATSINLSELSTKEINNLSFSKKNILLSPENEKASEKTKSINFKPSFRSNSMAKYRYKNGSHLLQISSLFHKNMRTAERKDAESSQHKLSLSPGKEILKAKL